MTTSAEEILEHHGIKGMKWGVRRDDSSGSSGGSGAAKPTRAEKKVAKADSRYAKEIGRANQGKATLAFHNELVTRVNRAADDVNRSDKWRDKDISRLSSKDQAAYQKDGNEAILRAFEDATRAHYGYNPSGTKRAVYDRKTDQIKLVDVPKSNVAHADVPTETAPDTTLQLKRNAKGFIVSATVVEPDTQVPPILTKHSTKVLSQAHTLQHRAAAAGREIPKEILSKPVSEIRSH